MTRKRVTSCLYNDRGVWTIKARVLDQASGVVKQKTKSTGLKVKDKTKRKAEDVMRDVVRVWQEEADAKLAPPSETMSKYVERFINRKEQKKIRANTIKSYRDYATNNINPYIGDIPISNIDINTLEAFYSNYLKTHKVSSARKVNVVVSGAIKEAVRDGVFTHNFANDIEFPKSERFSGSDSYSIEEVGILLDGAKAAGEPIYAAIMLAVCYGLRRSEVIGLRWKDIDLENNIIVISNTIVQNGSLRIESEHTKTKKSHRAIAILPVTIPYLKELKEIQSTYDVIPDKVVAWKDGSQIRPDYISRKTEKIMISCGLRVIRYHDLRHTASSILAPYVTAKQLQEFMGHEDISTTLGVYTHILDEQRRETSDIMNGVLTKLIN